jgi:putative transposase
MPHAGRSRKDEEGGSLASKRYLIVNGDVKCSARFRTFREEGGTEVVRLPSMSPNFNAHSERFVRSIKDACLRRTIFFGRTLRRRAINEFTMH